MKNEKVVIDGVRSKIHKNLRRNHKPMLLPSYSIVGSTITVPISAIEAVGELPVAGVGSPPLEDDGPCDGFQQGSGGADDRNHDDVRGLPLALGVQYVESLEHVDHAEDDHRVPDRVVVDVPVQPVLVVLLRSQQEREHLVISNQNM